MLTCGMKDKGKKVSCCYTSILRYFTIVRWGKKDMISCSSNMLSWSPSLKIKVGRLKLHKLCFGERLIAKSGQVKERRVPDPFYSTSQTNACEPHLSLDLVKCGPRVGRRTGNFSDTFPSHMFFLQWATVDSSKTHGSTSGFPMCILNLTELQQSKSCRGRKDHQERKREKAFSLFVLLSFMRWGNAWQSNSKEKERTRESKSRKEEKERSRQKQRERNKAVWHWGGKKTKQNKTVEKRQGRKEKALRGKDRKWQGKIIEKIIPLSVRVKSNVPDCAFHFSLWACVLSFNSVGRGMFCTFLGVVPPFVLSPDAASLFSFCFLSPSVSCFPLPFFSSLSLTGSEWDVAYHCIIRAIFFSQTCLKNGTPVSEWAFLFRGELAETAWSHQHKPKRAFVWDVTFTPCYSWEMVTALISRSFTRNQCWETFPCSWWASRGTIKDPHLALPRLQPQPPQPLLQRCLRTPGTASSLWDRAVGWDCTAHGALPATGTAVLKVIHSVQFGLEQKLNRFESHGCSVTIW